MRSKMILLALPAVLAVLGTAMLAQTAQATTTRSICVKNPYGEGLWNEARGGRGACYEMNLTYTGDWDEALVPFSGGGGHHAVPIAPPVFCTEAAEEKTGLYSSEKCEGAAKEGGTYDKVELPLAEFTKELSSTSSQKVTSTFKNPGAGLLEGEIKSTELTGETAPTSKKEGKFHIDFKKSECKALVSGKANSKGDAEGIILALGLVAK